jgi:hypothetical protein
MHRYHPDIERGDPVDAIYFDDCQDCEHHAKGVPYYQDQFKMNSLWRRMFDVEKVNIGDYRTRNEQVACMGVWKMYIFLQRFTDIDPNSIRVGELET